MPVVHPIRSVLVALLILSLSPPLRANDVMVFPLSSKRMPKNLKTLPVMLTEVVAQKVRDAGRSVDVADATLDDSASMLGCDPVEIKCLEMVAATLGAAELIYGAVSRGRRAVRAKVELTRFVPGTAPVAQTLSLRTRSLLDLSNEFAGIYGPLIAAQLESSAPVAVVSVEEEAPVEPPPEPEPVSPEPAPPEPEPVPSESVPPEPVERTEPSKLELDVRPGPGIPIIAWVVGGSGVALAGAGAGLLAVAGGIAGDVDSAPAGTVEELEDLRALEKRGRTFNYAGIGSLAAGGAAIATAVVLALQGSSSPPRLTWSPWLDADRVGASLRWEVF